MPTTCSRISSMRPIRRIVVFCHFLSAINSAFVVLEAVSVCILEDQVNGNPGYPVLDFAVYLSKNTFSALQFRQKPSHTLTPANHLIVPLLCLHSSYSLDISLFAVWLFCEMLWVY